MTRLHLPAVFLLIALSFSPSSALSDHATNILQQLQSVSDSFDATKAALDQYEGGYLGMTPLAMRAYDVWATIRTANIELDQDQLSPEESRMIVEKMKPLGMKAIEVMDDYKKKDHLVQGIHLSFLYPILLDAIHKESNDYMAAVKQQVAEEHRSSIDDISTQYSAAIDSVLQLCTANLGGTSGLLQAYNSGLSSIKRMFGFSFI